MMKIPAAAKVATIIVAVALYHGAISAGAAELYATITGRSSTAPALTVRDTVAGGDLLSLVHVNGAGTPTIEAAKVNATGVFILAFGASIATMTPTPTPTSTATATATTAPTATP